MTVDSLLGLRSAPVPPGQWRTARFRPIVLAVDQAWGWDDRMVTSDPANRRRAGVPDTNRSARQSTTVREKKRFSATMEPTLASRKGILSRGLPLLEGGSRDLRFR